MTFVKEFLSDESGAVTVDWVVLTAAIVGARRPEQIEETSQASGMQLTVEEEEKITQILQDRETSI